jgi:triphosphoribosyl-dephospho-CoA synthase
MPVLTQLPTFTLLQVPTWETCNRRSSVRLLAQGAVWALIEEARLTPKPALVDARTSGAHQDMNLDMLRRSAYALQATFLAIARRAFEAEESICLRESLSALGREGERIMLRETGGVNTHRGAIWTLGLLCTGAAMLGCKKQSVETICLQAARMARLQDSYALQVPTHGREAYYRYGVRGARGEAEDGFKHVLRIGLPMLKRSRSQGLREEQARLNSLVAIMAELNDTCLLHRGGLLALNVAKAGAKRVQILGGVSTVEGSRALHDLDRRLVQLYASPGGSADLLAAVLFLDFMERNLSAHG